MHRFKVQIEALPVQVVQAKIRNSLAATFDDLRREDKGTDSDASVLVVRLPVDQQLAPHVFDTTLATAVQDRLRVTCGVDAANEAEAFQRVRNRAVSVLHSVDGVLHLSNNINPHFIGNPLHQQGIGEAGLLNAIRHAEMDSLVAKSRALLSSPPGSAFRAPSGNVVANFLRVGNIQCDRDAVDAIFFWLLPHLKRCAGVLTDTWSISSIAYNVAALTTNYFGGPLRRVEMLPGYHDGSNAATGRADEIIARLADDCDVDIDRNELLVLISATQSGSLASRLDDAFNRLQKDLRPVYVAIFALGPTSMTSLRDLGDDEGYKFKLGNEIPNDPVEIDHQVYFPLTYKDVGFALGKAEATKHREFFDAYAGRNLISVHRDDFGSAARRHHAIHLDVAKIVNEDRFVGRLGAIIAELPPQILVIAANETADLIAARVCAVFAERGVVTRSVLHPNLYFSNRLTEDEVLLRDVITGSDQTTEILIIDDVCVSASHLSEYEKNLRTLEYKGRANYLTGISRMPSRSDWSDFKKRLRQRGPGLAPNVVEAVETITLPDLRDDDCPWCQETKLYERWATETETDLPADLTGRREWLNRGRRLGLTTGLFLTSPLSSSLTLGPDSFYVVQAASEADVFAAASAAIQDLRTIGKATRPLLGRRRFPLATVLEWKDYITQKWTDSILRATFLRAGHAEELIFTKAEEERDRTEALRELILSPSPGEHDVSLEILLAAGLGKVRITPGETMEEVVSVREQSDVARFMLERLKGL